MDIKRAITIATDTVESGDRVPTVCGVYEALLAEIKRLRAEYAKAAESYGGLCKLLDASGKARMRAEAEANDWRTQLDLAVGRDEQMLAALLAAANAELERLKAALREACDYAVSGDYPDILDAEDFMARLLEDAEPCKPQSD